MKILIADDNKQITSILDEYARKEKYETVIVHDGQAAVQAFEAHHPDLLLLDVMMPVIDGFSVCREIRKISQVPIIMITARGEGLGQGGANGSGKGAKGIGGGQGQGLRDGSCGQ
jgi:DNA-binding response OmpR family regulator